MTNKVIKCIKGFDKDLKCRGFQYEVGKEYETDSIEMCMKGFHAIDETESPLLVFRYYSPCDSYGNPNRFCLVELSGETIKEGDKTVGTKIKIVKEIGIEGVVGLQREWAKAHSVNNDEDSCKHSVTNTGDFSSASNTGDCSVVTNTGIRSIAVNTGNYSVSTNTGNSSVSTNTGDYSVAADTGFYSLASNTGDYSVAANTGVFSSVINKGNYSLAAHTGNYSSSEVSGKSSIAVAYGNNCKAKGVIGCALVLTERGDWDDDIKGFPIKNILAVIVDGVNVKADTWYTLKDGKLTEV